MDHSVILVRIKQVSYSTAVENDDKNHKMFNAESETIC